MCIKIHNISQNNDISSLQTLYIIYTNKIIYNTFQ